MSTVQSQVAIRLQFLDYLFEKNKGILCLATASSSKADFRQHFFNWPEQREIVGKFVDEQQQRKNIWFCVNLLSQPERKKEHCLHTSFAWSDLDAVIPTFAEEQNVPLPTCVVESSPSRYQAYWRIEGGSIPPDVAEDFSRKIAYKLGADKSGWDLTQLLRLPWTNNFKYDPPVQTKLLSIESHSVSADLLDRIELPQVDEFELNGNGIPTDPLPDVLPQLDNILYKYKTEGKTDEEFTRLFSIEPEQSADWSKILWRFIHKCFEVGMEEIEILVLAYNAGCNKYKRDGRPPSYLWREIQKAAQEHRRFNLILAEKTEIITMPHLVDFDEFEEDAFIRDYKTWANAATDAPEQYHELTCFIALSSILCSGLWLGVEWGELVPNLWGLVLGESTLTRKTTAMRLAMDMLKDIDDSLILASDGSAEGLLTGLSHRPKRVSIFWKDEVSGFFDSLNKKDYLAGFKETLTQLYDVPKVYPRMLRKETITISEPYFIFFGGGIRDKVYSLIDDEYITSGFIPRFLVVSAENDLSRVRRTGPRTELTDERKAGIIGQLCDMKEKYNIMVDWELAGQKVKVPARIEARLTDDAWKAYQEIEEKLVNAGANSDLSMLALPTFQRMGFSCLKMSLLIAASRREPSSSNLLTVEVSDIKQAAFYVERWGHYSIDLILNAGKSQAEKMISRAMSLVARKNGLTKSEVMQRLHLSAREAKELIDTMTQRGLIDVKGSGRGVRIYSV